MIRSQHLSLLLVLIAVLALGVSGCKKDEEEAAEEESGGGGAAAAAPSEAEPGTAAEEVPVGDAAAQTELLKTGPGEIDAAVAMRMMGDTRPQRLVFRPAPLVESGLVAGVFEAFPPAKAMYEEAVADAGDVDLLEAIELAVLYSDAKTLDSDTEQTNASFEGIIVTRGDSLAKLVSAIQDMDGEDSPGDTTRGEIHLVFAGELDAAAIDTLMKEFDATTPDEVAQREDIADAVVLLAEANTKGDGHNYVYAWPHGIIAGRTLAEGEALDAARQAAATMARRVEAGVKGSGGSVPDDVVLDLALQMEPTKSVDIAVSASDTLDVRFAMPLEALGPKEERDKQLSMIKMFTGMPEKQLREMVGSNVPPEAIDAAMLLIQSLSIEEEGDMLVVTASPSIDDLIATIPKP